MTLFNKNGVSLSARSYYSLRLHLHRKRWLLRLVQILRAYVLFGPLRKPIVLYYQKFSNNGPNKGKYLLYISSCGRKSTCQEA